ncbi:unnamed protein product [Mytilus coruscus]|uniref:Uncharacterized protein n=1 Tax=Mytilus coruscus TaxID=42192 RepID=A0A6J8DWD6_MYTCO|nr:unnamed protein product [Mytilus coruscus]
MLLYDDFDESENYYYDIGEKCGFKFRSTFTNVSNLKSEKCVCLDGKLAEFETVGENGYIKNELRTLNTAVDGYCIVGYNFNKDNDMEWMSQPDQAMPFSDMWSGQANGLTDQLCMVNWKSWDINGQIISVTKHYHIFVNLNKTDLGYLILLN